eukprot:2917012-Rhodomonas_salina.3
MVCKWEQPGKGAEGRATGKWVCNREKEVGLPMAFTSTVRSLIFCRWSCKREAVPLTSPILMIGAAAAASGEHHARHMHLPPRRLTPTILPPVLVPSGPLLLKIKHILDDGSWPNHSSLNPNQSR